MRAALLQVLEDFLTTLVFVVVLLLTNSVYIAVGVAMAIAIAQLAAAWLKGRSVSIMQWFSCGLVIVLGSASLALDDPRYVMIKPTIGHFAIAAIMLRRGWVGRYMPLIVKENASEWVIVTAGYMWSGFIFTLGIINFYIATSFSVEIWAWWISVGSIGAKVLGVAIHYVVFRTMVVRNMRLASPGTP
jgi:intracellular septation protein